ncbi:SH3 domain-containing protein [Aurantimonas sp. A2-1-M11]|uniref:SH3 domain-containing protein n=1 Tax=Aurantimonas sp. A2-1-M11 TaxID=3113712 RepID=UPI002F942A0A
MNPATPKSFPRQTVRSLVRALCLAGILQGASEDAEARTELPLPRFVSLDAETANVRRGPSVSYEIVWTYVRSGIPLEIFQEFGNWRRIRGSDGESGWIHGALLSGRRTAEIAPWIDGPARLTSQRSLDSTVRAKLAKGVLLRDFQCDGHWCHVEITQSSVAGYLAQSNLWGVYPGEKVNLPAEWSWLPFM